MTLQLYQQCKREQLNLCVKERILKMTQGLDVLRLLTPRKSFISVPHMVMDDRRLTINQIVKPISISRERVENILHYELGMNEVSAWWVPCLLTPDQNHTSLMTSQETDLVWGRFSCMFPNPGWVLSSLLWTRDKETVPKKGNVVSSAGKVIASDLGDTKWRILCQLSEAFMKSY